MSSIISFNSDPKMPQYFIYISDSKVDMLYEQIPARLTQKLAAELKINLKFLSTTVKQERLEVSRIAKLRVVIDFIQRGFPVGTIDEPRDYFSGILDMKWGDVLGSTLVYFSGMTSQTIIALGGSQHHMIGGRGSANVSIPDRKVVGSSDVASIVSLVSSLERGLAEPFRSVPFVNNGPITNDDYLYDVASAARKQSGPLTRVSFFCRTLLRGPLEKSRRFEVDASSMFGKSPKKVLLGTPFFVALAVNKES